MPSQISHIPHIKNVRAGMEKYDPMHQSIFLVGFTVPPSMIGEYDLEELNLLSQQVISVSGLDNLQQTIKTYSQKYFGVDVEYCYPVLDYTGIEYSIQFNLNLRNKNDAYVFKIFKHWLNLILSLSTGVYALKQFYCGEMVILEANRDGTIWRQVVLKNVFIKDIKGLETLDYSDPSPRILTVSFHADYWDETIG